MNRRLLTCLPVVMLALFVLPLGCDDDGVQPNAEFDFSMESMPAAIKDIPYSETMEVSGGTAPYTWSVSQGEIPVGMVVTPANESVTVAGTPTVAGTFSFTLRAEDAKGAADTTPLSIVVLGSFEVSGNWQYTIDVTAADGVCEGEENDVPSTDTITVTQSPGGTVGLWLVEMTGFLGNPANTLTGTMNGSHITVSGSYPEDGGTTTSTHYLVIAGPSTLSGDEVWSWSGPGGDCPNGRSSVTATR